MELNDDYVYLFMLLFSIAFGSVTSNISNQNIRKWTSSLCGLSIIFSVSGVHGFHPIASFVIHTTLIKLSPRSSVHWINFFVGFAYLFFFRLCGYGPQWLLTTAPGHTNAIQVLILASFSSLFKVSMLISLPINGIKCSPLGQRIIHII